MTASIPFALLRLSVALLFCATVALPTEARGQNNEPTKYRLRVQEVEATSALRASTTGTAQKSLEQILDACDSQLLNAIEQTRKFEMVARDPAAVIREQDFAASGNIDSLDPQTAQQFKMAGVKYIAMVTLDNFQDVTRRMTLEGGLGKTNAERRTIQVQAVVRIVDATRATVLRSTNVAFEKAAVDEIIAGSTSEGGRKTDALIGQVSNELATRAANAITDMLYPAKVIGYTNGVITFNRTKSSGADKGQYWQVFGLGEEMIDPDTGESLGSEEISIGWAIVTDVGDRTSKAHAILDNGIDRGQILRFSTDGLPAGIDPNQRATGSASMGVLESPSTTAPRNSKPSPSRSVENAEPESKSPRKESDSTEIGEAPAWTMKYAIFVKNRVAQIPDDRVSALEDQIVASATDSRVSIIRREDVANAVSTFASEGPNAGTAKESIVDRMLSDSTSAIRLAEALGADYLLIASMSSLESEVLDFNDGTTKTKIEQQTLRCTYSVIDGVTGASIIAGPADSVSKVRQSDNLTVSGDRTVRLMNESGRLIGEQIRRRAAEGEIRAPAAPVADTNVQVNIYLADMRVPGIRRNEAGDYLLTNEEVNVGVMNCEVLVDGLSVGSAPGSFSIRPGMHRIEVRRPLCVPEIRMINVKPGMVLQIGVRLTDEGRRQWMENAAFFQELRKADQEIRSIEAADRVRQTLADAELEKAKGIAKFWQQSGFRVNWDTSTWDGLIN